jgi:ADP-heptose:LPS heptosyltransferase
MSPEAFRSRTEAQKKQREVGAFDREMLRQVIAAARLERPALLHPGLMYRLFRPFWNQEATVHRVDDYTRYERIHVGPDSTLAARLPSDYVAVRFYFSSSFPDTTDNRAFADSIVRALASSTHVVMLGPGFRVDDHRDFAPAVSSRIHAVDDLMTPDRNLEVQTAVIAGARAFVGTYGGYAYLAPFCNVPAIAFYSNRDGFHAYHLELADRVFRRMNTASLVALDVRDAALLRAALGAAQDQHA